MVIAKIPASTVPAYVVIGKDRRPDPCQLGLFDRDRWLDETLDIALTMARSGDFWFHELRDRCAVGPVHPNQWGVLTKKMKAAGLVIKEIGKSPSMSRRGGYECKWGLKKT